MCERRCDLASESKAGKRHWAPSGPGSRLLSSSAAHLWGAVATRAFVFPSEAAATSLLRTAALKSVPEQAKGGRALGAFETKHVGLNTGQIL